MLRKQPEDEQLNSFLSCSLPSITLFFLLLHPHHLPPPTCALISPDSFPRDQLCLSPIITFSSFLSSNSLSLRLFVSSIHPLCFPSLIFIITPSLVCSSLYCFLFFCFLYTLLISSVFLCSLLIFSSLLFYSQFICFTQSCGIWTLQSLSYIIFVLFLFVRYFYYFYCYVGIHCITNRMRSIRLLRPPFFWLLL